MADLEKTSKFCVHIESDKVLVLNSINFSRLFVMVLKYVLMCVCVFVCMCVSTAVTHGGQRLQ